MSVDDVEVVVEGSGPPMVMVHGWPDTLRLWDVQVEALKGRYCCIRFTLPGYERNGLERAFSLEELLQTLRRVVEDSCLNQKATLLLHDWGCVIGYEFAKRHPEMVERIVGVDIGDVGSAENREDIGAKGKLMVIAYQTWLAGAWKIGGRIGDAMARWMAHKVRCPTDRRTIGAHMGYSYAVRWFGIAGGMHGLTVLKPDVPVLFMFGERKPFMFHSRAWAERLAASPDCRVIPFATGHWIMMSRPQEFNEALLTWLRDIE